jgi:ribosomal protein S12 methylthiotransferase accessory factor
MTRPSALLKAPGTQRVMHPTKTFDRVWRGAHALGVTRLADITGLDRIGIPTYSAVIPRSRDGLSVTNGKGLSPIEAKVGAIMEAIERQIACQTRLPLIQGSFQELRNRLVVLDPRNSKYPLVPDYCETREYSWVSGRDLISNEEVLVPAHVAGYKWWDVSLGPIVGYGSSSGLASGNNREEAICQALCELIERDAWTLADLGAHLLPLVRRRIADPDNAENRPDDFEMFPSLEGADDEAGRLFRAAGLNPILHDITSDLGIPTIMAVVADESFAGFSMVHGGAGSHPDARVAVKRALTEVAQSRCVDIQGVREDLIPPGSAHNGLNLHTRRVTGINRNLWPLGESRQPRHLEELPSAVHNDIEEDLDHLLRRMRSRGIAQVIVIDFASPDAPFAVVRVIVPDLEQASIQRAPVGQRALQFWRCHV